MSDLFRHQAAQNVTQNIASMRGQRELARDGHHAETDETSAERAHDPRDSVRLGQASTRADAPLGQSDAAQLSRPGAAPSSAAGPRQGDPHARGAGVHLGGEQGSTAPDAMLTDGALLSAAGAGGLLEDTDPSVRQRRREEARRLAREGVPIEVLEASGEIVKGQLHPVRGPKASLRELKAVPEAAAHETAPADFAAEMDIADSAAPLLEESLDAPVET